MKILVTGGAGFVGSHLVDALVKKRHQVTVFDNLDQQVHGASGQVPAYLNKNIRFIKGDIRDATAVRGALKSQDVLFHLAAAVGVGQSMYEIERYTDINTMGTAVVLEEVLKMSRPLKKMIAASSMSIYGEGLYKCPSHGKVYPKLRDFKKSLKNWDLTCPKCTRTVKPLPTSEDKPLIPASIYAINKRDTEEMFLCTGASYKIPTVALRFFNIYGDRQALSNPYTGASVIFGSAMLNGKSPIVFEDGEQSRDFTHVSDIVQALTLVMRSAKANGNVYNVGTGRRVSINKLIKLLARELNYKGPITITDEFRAGDIRHCYADIKALKKIGFKPKIKLEEGVKELCQWIKQQTCVSESDKAFKELKSRQLSR